MAHQAHNIPWNVLASNLKWRKSSRCKHGAVDLHWRTTKENRGKEITHFVKAFAKTIHEQADCERKKYPEKYDTPEAKDVVLSDEVCQRVMPTVHRFQTFIQKSRIPYAFDDELPSLAHDICNHESPDDTTAECCQCALPWQERRMEAFLRQYKMNDCYRFYEVNLKSFTNQEIFKTLLMHGEMDTLLRIYSHPDTQLKKWWEQSACQCEGPLGWDQIHNTALMSYLVLNIFSCFPKTRGPPHVSERDYTDTMTYQIMIHQHAQEYSYSNIARYPHIDFFGVAEGQFDQYWADSKENEQTLQLLYDGTYPYGRLPYLEFLSFEKEAPNLPHAREGPQAYEALKQKGLSNELVDYIMELAEYGPKTRRLPVAHDPFHQSNSEELGKYLEYCWVLLVRCEVIARTIGLELNWEEMISSQLAQLFRCDRCPRIEKCVWENSENNTVFI